MLVLSIDIGILNFAFVVASVHDNFHINQVTQCELINMRTLTLECSVRDCPLEHTKTLCDFTSHIFEKCKNSFEQADIILIERQPITSSLVAIEQLIFFKYRQKTTLVSPNAVHAHYKMSDRYEMRKKESQMMADPYLTVFERYRTAERKHDMADAMIFLLYWLEINQKREPKVLSSYIADLSQFAYQGD